MKRSKYSDIWQQLGAVLCCCLLPLMLCGQRAPRWMDDRWRETSYPAKDYFIGFVSEAIPRGESVDEATLRLENEAKRKMAESIVVNVKSEQTMVDQSVQKSGLPEQFTSLYHSTVSTLTDVEIAGLQVEAYFHKAKKRLYAFACVSKRKLMSDYTAIVDANLRQAKSAVKIATQLERQREKAKARKRYKETAALLEKTEKLLYLLQMIDANHSGIMLSISMCQELQDEAMQALARLEFLVYVSDREELFGQSCSIVANKLQTDLANDGYRFTDDPARADFTVNLRATTRKIGDATEMIVFCYADVVIEWVDNHARQTVYKEELSYKGGSTTFEQAGREALEEAAEEIVEKLNKIMY
jgi:hypothetical protein